jgi:hypothetical protein
MSAYSWRQRRLLKAAIRTYFALLLFRWIIKLVGSHDIVTPELRRGMTQTAEALLANWEAYESMIREELAR